MPLLNTLSGSHGVGPVCHELDIAPSTYYRHQEQRQPPEKRSLRQQRDDPLQTEIRRVYDENHSVYGVRKIWRQLRREGINVARCPIARLMKAMGLTGVLRGKKVRTTVSRRSEAAHDRVNRPFVAARPDPLWVADLTYLSPWQGFAYVAFIIGIRRGHRGLAGVVVDGDGVRTGCAGAGAVGPSPVRHYPSLGPRLAVGVAGIHPTAAGS